MDDNSKANNGSEDEQLYLLEVIVNSLDVFKEGILETFQSSHDVTKEETTDGLEEDEGHSEGDVEKKDAKKGPVRIMVKFFDFPTIEIMEHEFKENETKDEDSYQTGEERGLKSEGGIPPLDKSDPLYKSKKWEEMRWKAEGKRTSNWEMGQDLMGPIPTSTASRFTSGKSCLFPLNPKEMMNVIRNHSVEVQVHRDEAENEPAHLIGQLRMALGQEFIDAVAIAETPAVLPVTAYIEDDVEVTNVFGEVTGVLNLLVRLSCFGPTIFTQFKYIQGEKGFKFSTSESGVGRPTKSQVEKKVSAKGKSTLDEWPREPFFTGEENLPLRGTTSALCDDKFKLPVPWRKIHDLPVSPKICGPKRLFKGRGESSGAAVQDCPLYNPALPQQNRQLQSPTSPQNMFQCSCCQTPAPSPSTVPPEFGSLLPFQVQQLLPGQRGTGKGPLEIPPGIKFPCQFGQNWIVEQDHPTYVCTNQYAKCAKHYPGIEQASPHLKTAISGKEWSNTDYSTMPTHSSANTDPNRSNVRIIPCPNLPQDRPTVRCGLDGLLDPDYHNLQNILQSGLVPPICPPDSSRGAPSLCTCPKVPIPPPEPISGPVKCECTNIMKSLKPIELPYTCPLAESQSPVKRQTNTCPPCPPVPIKLPPPPPDCPLAKLLMEANNEDERQASKTSKRTSNTPGLADHPQTKAPVTKADALQESCHPQMDGAKSTTVSSLPGKETPQSGPTVDDTASEKESKRVKDKANKILQEEVDYYDKTTSGAEDGVSRTTTRTTDSASTSKLKKQAKRKKKSKETPSREQLPPSMPGLKDDKKSSLTYIATAGIYPGLVIGHKNCVPPVRLVPKRMGWLWNIKDCTGYLKPGRGWRPGSIQTSVMKVIDNVKTKQSKERKAVKSTRSGEHTKKTESMKTMASAGGDAPLLMPYDESPTLHVHKKSTGLMYFSLVPPKEARRKGPKKKKMSARGELVDATSSSDEPPVHFVIDPKNPDGKEMNPDLYETEETSTNSEDSYQLDLTSPSTLRYRQAQYLKHDFEIQVNEEDFGQNEGKVQATEPQSKDGKEEKKKSAKKKGSTLSKRSKKSNSSQVPKKKIKP